MRVQRVFCAETRPSRCVTEAELAQGFVGELPSVDVVHCLLARRGAQSLVVEHCRFPTDFQVQIPFAFLFGGGFLVVGVALRDGDIGAIGKKLHRLPPREGLVLHEELYYVAAFAATETLEYLPLRTDDKTRRFFAVKRATSLEVCAVTTKLQIRADDVHYVVCGFDFVGKLKHIHV